MLAMAIGALQVSTSAFAQDNEPTKVDCSKLSDDAAWVAVCDASLAIDEVSGSSGDKQEEASEAASVASFGDLIELREHWQNRTAFDGLSEEQRAQVYWFFNIEAGNLAFAEWACSTGEFEAVNSKVLSWAEALFGPELKAKAIAQYQLHLRLSGFGNRYSRCDYKALASNRVKFAETEQFLSMFREEVRP
jgi:hypothetical protein